MSADNPYELVEIVIHSETDIPTDAQKEKHWRKINKIPKEFECDHCVWGIQDMEEGIPTYCHCFYGRQHIMQQLPPWYVQWGGHIVAFFREIFKN